MLKKQSVLNNHNGFTLVELIVVLVLMGILLSISAASLIAFQDTSRQLKKDEAAQTIFFAAQNKLTEMEGSGQIEELRERLKYEDGSYSINDYVPVFSTISKDEFNPWFSNYITRTCLTTNDDKTEEGKSRLVGTQAMLMTDHDIWGTYDKNVLLSLRAKAGDYELYTDDPEAVEVQTRILFELIQDTVADQEILNGAICLEIAPEEGQVFSALYSDSAYEFYYGHEDNGSEGRVDISRRHEGARASKSIGYYGVSSLTHVTYVPVTGLNLGELTYDNGDVLSYHLSVKQIEGIDLGVLDYTITVYDTATSRKALEFTVSGSDVKEKQPDIMDNMVDCPTTRYDAFGNSMNLGSYRIPIYKERIGDEETDGLGFILDAADISAMTILLDANGGDEGYKIRNGRGTDGTFCQSLSFFRFGTWTEIEGAWTDNIFVEITVNSDELDEPAVARSKSTSPFFADASTERKRPQDNSGANNYKTYGISNCRHFYNMRYYEDLEITTLGLPNAHANELSKFRIDFVLRNDLDWGEFAETSLYASSSNYYPEKIQGHKAVGFDFPSFKELRTYDYLIGLDETAAQTEVDRLAVEYPTYGFTDTDALTKALENDWKVHDPAYAAEETSKTISVPDLIKDNLQLSYRISNLSISMKSNMVYGLYRGYAPGRDKPTGLFLENNGVIKYIAVDQSKVVGSNKVGMICGANSGTILYSGTLSTRTGEHPEPTIVQGIKYVGGVFGYQSSKGLPDWTGGYRDLTISYLENHARVLGTEYVGGITSCITNGNDTRINDTGSDTEDYAGIRNIVIKHCDNYGQVRGVYAPEAEGVPALDPADEEAVLQHKQSVRYIGGIVGYMNNCGTYTKNSQISNLWQDNYQYNSNRIVYCYSYPVYDETYDKDILDELNKLAQLKHYQLAGTDQEDLLHLMQDYNVGCCVGGIVGYGNQLVIDHCGVRVKADKVVNGYDEELAGGYIFGDQYVGGIIGFNDSYLNDSCINACSVVGNYYVGGIIGINIHAVVQSTEEERKELVTPADIDSIVFRSGTNWAHAARAVNIGNVYGLYDYAGGVAGYSAGLLGTSRCEKLGDIRPIVMGRNYVGGITGRSVKGSLGGNGCNVEADINGENYVGGLVGYIGPTDPCPAEWSTYNSGNIYAHGSFAGGIAGVIMNPNAYTGNRRVSRPNSITAKYYVGGITGANVMNPTSNLSPNYYVEKNNNGELHAVAYAGGYIGLNILYSIPNEDAERMIGSLAALDRMGDELTTSDEGRSMKDVVTLVHELEGQFGNNSNSMEMQQNGLHCFLSSISPIMEEGYEHELVYAAGVVGYNAEQSIMNFNDFRWEYHKVDLITTTGIEVEEEIYDPDTHSIITKNVKHAYTGSLIGINNRLSTISGARSFSKFSTQSSYRGGLCEVNYGTILNPYTSNNNYIEMYYSDDPEINYLGAVCGRNEGTITVGNLSALRLKGTGVMGILAAENYGTIFMTGSSIRSVQITGDDSGAVAGILIGRNLGSFEYTADSPLTITNNSYVTCGDCVGGLIGEQVGPITLLNVNNTMNDGPNNNCIQAKNGTCGSLIGRLIVKDGDTLIEGYQFGDNRNITGKNVGGIIGSIILMDDHKAIIKDSQVTRVITGDGADSYAAGIVGAVQAASSEVTGYVLIRNCIVHAEVQNKTDAARSSGIVYDAGGRTVIDGCRVYCPKAGHGITASPALAIMNCFDGTLKGSELFGSVNAPGPDTIKNNYSMQRSNNYVPQETADFPEDYTTVFLEKPVRLYTYKNNGVYEIYAVYEVINAETGDVDIATSDSGIRVNAPDSNPGNLSNYYNDYNKGSTWKKMDEAFMEYMVDHSVLCDY